MLQRLQKYKQFLQQYYSHNRYVSTWGAAAATAVAITGGSVFFVANIAFLTSAIPAIFSRGAPYLPTNSKSLSFLLDEVLPSVLSKPNATSAETCIRGPNAATPTTIFDLGSGDGRVVIEAAERGYKAVGYEINPFLVLLSYIKAARRRPSQGSAEFHWSDIWKVDNLHQADIIFVYGLGPIMDALSEKIIQEAKPNVIVVSYVFQMIQSDMWTLVYTNIEKNIYVYQKKRGPASFSS
jgi:hypothetical protein